MGEMKSRKWRINLLCIAGSIISMLSLFFPWLTDVPNDIWVRLIFGNFTWDLVRLASELFNANIYPTILFPAATCFGALLIIIGTFSSFVTPIGGWIQLSGLALFFIFSLDALGTNPYFGMPFSTTYLDFGFYLGIIATIITLASFIKPTGIGYHKKILFFGDRLLTVNPLQQMLFEKFKIKIYNKFAIISAVIGLIAIFLTWLYATSISGINGAILIGTNDLGQPLRISLIIYLFGALISILTPIGSLFQLAGIALFMIIYPKILPLGEGAIMGLISSIFVLVSLFYSPIDKEIEKSNKLKRGLANFGFRIELRCFYCGNLLYGIREPCENCGSKKSE